MKKMIQAKYWRTDRQLTGIFEYVKGYGVFDRSMGNSSIAQMTAKQMGPDGSI